MTKYNTEKRKANVGERILITDAELDQGAYKNGSVATVSVEEPCVDSLVYVNEWERSVHYSEYEVIVGTKPRKSERISALETEVAELKAKVEALEKAKEPTVHNVTISAPQTEDARGLAEAMTKILAKEPFSITKTIEELAKTRVLETPNQLRWGTIQRAKAFVAEGYDRWFGGNLCVVEYVVNSDKRTVVALVRSKRYNDVRARGIAKCDPSDVFNADIGKAIALARALGVDVLIEFVKAVQPTEVVVGHKVRGNNIPVTYEVTAFHKDVKLDGEFGRAIAIKGLNSGAWVGTEQVTIIEDTDAVYE